ncbi:MAG: biotin/lipoyl-binding protein, partial [Candidatus Acidiferrales bacterium]
MKNKMVFIISFIGALSGIGAAILSGFTEPTLPPAYNPAASPYPSAIYAEGIVESAQTSGENSNIYPEVAGTVKEIRVAEGQQVKAGQPLLRIDDSIQRATAEQQGSSAEAAAALLRELKAQPRKETLDVADAQVVAAEATWKTAQDTLHKEQAAYEIDPRSISKDALDSALNAVAVAKANLIVAKKQDDLIRAGAWVYDIQNQDRQQHALAKAYAASSALLAKYTLR